MVEVLHQCCAGLDVHQASVVACLLGGASKPGSAMRPGKQIRTFATTGEGLSALVAWLRAEGVTHACMEATGVYWRPLFVMLESTCVIEAVVANARHIKAVPGRKTDVKDAEWLADLLRHGLVRNSFIPAKPFRELRDLTRYRTTLVNTQSSERQRLIKLLESVGIKLAGVLSDVFGLSGRAIVRALIEGTKSPAEMASLARGHARKKHAALLTALDVSLAPHHRTMLKLQLDRVEGAEADIAALDIEIDLRLEPYADQMAALCAIPGIERVVAAIIIAELGVDLAKFATFKHLCAWVGTCAGNNQSANRAKPARARQGNPYLKTALCNAAISASRKKGSYYKAKYHKLKARRGGGKAALAIANKLLIAIFHVLNGRAFADLTETWCDKRAVARTAQRHLKSLRELGYKVSIEAIPQTANQLIQ